MLWRAGQAEVLPKRRSQAARAETQNVHNPSRVGDVTAARGHFVFPCQKSWLANLWAEWEKQRETDRHRILKTGLRMETKLPFHLLLLFTIWDPEKGVMGSFVIGLARGRSFRIFSVLRGHVSAPSQHMGTQSQRRFNKRVALAKLERDSIKNRTALIQLLNEINNNKLDENVPGI